MILPRLYNRYLKKPLKLYWWRYEYPHKLNFGDEITPLIIERLFGRRCEWSPPDKCEMAGAGSIIEILQELSHGNHVRVWGSGFIKEGEPNSSPNLDFLAVRGKFSLKRIQPNDPQKVALGDPGLLASLAIEKTKTQKKHMVGIIPHYVDASDPLLDEIKNGAGSTIINALDTPEEIISQINSCQLIVSSSLHGLIISESYGVPNYWLKVSDKLTGGGYKFKDYYSVFGAEPAAAELNKLTQEKYLAHLIDSYEPKNISLLQEKLVKSFR